MTRISHASLPFFYMATKPTGGRSFGVRQAASERALAETLRRDKLVLLRSWRLPAWLASEKRLTLKDHAVLNEQLAQLLSRGVPLVEALEVTAQTVRPAASGRIKRIRELVAQGTSFADACKRVGSFDTVTVAIYRAAERSGDLAGASKQLGVTARRQLAVSGKAATLMVYPVIVLVIGLGVGLFMLTWVLPRLGGALEQSQVELPALTKGVIGVGEFLRTQWLFVLLGVMGAVLVLVAMRAKVVRAMGGFARRLPLMREVLLAQESARFFSVMAAMTRSGVPLADALSVSVHALGHPSLRRELTRLRDRLVEGGVLRQLIDDVETFPLATRRLLIAAERAGDLESAFDTLAQDMSDEVDKRSARLLAALEPIFLLLLFGFIGTLMLAIMIPMIKSTSQAF